MSGHDGADKADGADGSDTGDGNRTTGTDGGSLGRVTPEELTAESPFTLPGFFAALAERRLLGGRCTECDTVLIPPRPACYACGSREIGIEELSKTGEIVTYTEVARPAPAFEADAPLTIAIVELDSGARLTGRVAADYDAVEIGTGVSLTVRDLTEKEREFALDHEEEWPLHVFEPT
jgi:uncharacterized OB-fold protein